MSKYSKSKVNKICKLISSDSYTIPEICRLSGISESTYHEWKATKLDFSEAIKNAEQQFLDSLAADAKKSLRKKVQGYNIVEKKTVTMPSKKKDSEAEHVLKEETTEKHIQPDVAAIIFTLVNADPEHWQNRFHSELTGKDGKDLIPEFDLSKLTAEERALLLKIAENAQP